MKPPEFITNEDDFSADQTSENHDPVVLSAATRLQVAEAAKIVCQPVRELIGETDLALAYAVQQMNTVRRLAAGVRMVGKKIGLTSLAVQTQLGVDQPDYGILFGDREVLNGTEISMQELMQPKAEVEIAFVLGKDLDRPSLGIVDVISAIDYALVAIEIVGSRIANWNIKITDTIADNASASHFVLGHQPVRLENFDVVNCKMEMKKNGQVVSTGIGSACLGSPVNATLWLARTMASLGNPLRAGEVILTGALGPVVAAEAGDHFVAKIEGLGGVEVLFVE